MKDRNVVVKIMQVLTAITLYYIVGNNSIFLYVITLSLYNIYISCFSHITLKETLKKINNNNSKLKILKFTTLSMIIICSLFILLSIFISDSINIFLGIENTFLPYLIMSISVISEPLTKIFLEFLESYNKPKLSNNLLYIYYILEIFFFLLISILTIRILKLPNYLSTSLLYLSKIISFIIITTIVFVVLKKQNIDFKEKKENKISCINEVKEILKNNNHKSIINIIKNSYYYISIIILYAVLSSRYSYEIITIEKELTFIYFYILTFINFINNTILSVLKYHRKKESIINYIYKIFKVMMNISIILGITSPLICKIIFNDSTNSIYLTIMLFLSIFISLYDITINNIKNNKIIYISLIIGLISKLILILPLINSFYRMGYNLIYGDIISTMIGMFITVIINYIYIKINTPKEKSLEKILTTLYNSILLCIILVILQFIIPIKTNNYLKSLILLVVYITVSLMFIKIKNKRRG